jgi:NAD(P)-dependent dehydrogenase (short-subunit alcohol dehydrogenase family)
MSIILVTGANFGAWAEAFAVNTMGPVRVMHALLPQLKRAQPQGDQHHKPARRAVARPHARVWLQRDQGGAQ